jgi:hypothetical protein
MTKPKRTAQRADDWTFDMPAGLARHAPTGLQFRMLPMGAHVDSAAEYARLQADGWLSVGQFMIPGDVKDRRQVQIDPGDANAPAVSGWAVLVQRDAYTAAGDQLAAVHGPFQAKDMLTAICRDAGQRWLFRAKLERGWADGRRAT